MIREQLAGTWHWMIYRKTFLFGKLFFERWNNEELANVRLNELNCPAPKWQPPLWWTIFYLKAALFFHVLANPRGTKKKKVDDFKAALIRLVHAWENAQEYAALADSGCIECTAGTVPNNQNTGLCAYHEALKVLK